MTPPFQIVVKSIVPSTREKSQNEVRLRPIVGQGFDSDTRVAFPTEVRYDFKVGTLFKVWVVIVEHPTQPYPRAVRHDEIEIVSKDEAKAFIKSQRAQNRRRGQADDAV